MKISFYGDSITTYEGYVPSDAPVYYPTYSSTVDNPNKTWWYQVLALTGTTFHTNVSYSGSTVSGSEMSAGENETRISQILKNGEAPDILIIYLGINDVVSGHTADIFKQSYENMLTKIKIICPNVQIIICNLPYETASDGTGNASESMVHIGLREEINEVIKTISKEQNLPLVDLASLITKETDSFGNKINIGDNIHPNATGMTVIANAVSKVLKSLYNN